MLVGSVTISSSMPRSAIAARVFARRAAYSARSKGSWMSWGMGFSCLVPGSAFEGSTAVTEPRAFDREGGDGGILGAGAGEVADRHVFGADAAAALASDDLAEFGHRRVR